jgi:hypothetical protein
MLPARKLMAVGLWEGRGLAVVEIMQQGITVTSEMYFQTLNICLRPFGTKCMEC